MPHLQERYGKTEKANDGVDGIAGPCRQRAQHSRLLVHLCTLYCTVLRIHNHHQFWAHVSIAPVLRIQYAHTHGLAASFFAFAIFLVNAARVLKWDTQFACKCSCLYVAEENVGRVRGCIYANWPEVSQVLPCGQHVCLLSQQTAFSYGQHPSPSFA